MENKYFLMKINLRLFCMTWKHI